MSLQNLSERIKQHRKAKGLTQANLAELLDMSEMTIRRWEAEKTSPRMDEIKKLAQVLEIPTNELLDNQQFENNSHSVNADTFVKNSAYEDKTEIKNSVPSMAYWGSLVDNAEKAAENGKNLDLVIGLIKTALDIVKSAASKKTVTT